jgi:hypothetical protein
MMHLFLPVMAVIAAIVLASIITTLLSANGREQPKTYRIIFVILAIHLSAAALQFLYTPSEMFNPVTQWRIAIDNIGKRPENCNTTPAAP